LDILEEGDELIFIVRPTIDVRCRERTTAERANARLKDEFRGRFVRVRGHAKVMCHLMFGILALTVDQLMRLLGGLTQRNGPPGLAREAQTCPREPSCARAWLVWPRPGQAARSSARLDLAESNARLHASVLPHS
jgi:hypothetical protein